MKIGGIIYPSAFQVTEMIGNMNAVFRKPQKVQYLHHKNLEIGAWGVPIGTNERKNIWALFDGKIHNSDLLREELKIKGFQFKTETEAELLVHAYDAWQERFLQRLNGPFACAVFDEEKEILLIARDRLGQKPIYWTTQGEYWLFSSEIKGLLATGVVPQTPSIEGLAAYLHFGFVPQDFSLINGVNKLLPGHFLKVDLNRQVTIDQFWSLSALLEKPQPSTAEQTYHQLGELLEDAIHLSLPKEGKIGTFLMGNLGSSALTWFLTHLCPRERLHAFTTSFEENSSPELENAQSVASLLSIPHTATHIQPEAIFQELPAIVWNLDEPVADLNVLRTWSLAKMARSECRSVYADLGWEEMFGGSLRYFLPEKDGYPQPPIAYFLAQLPHFVRETIIFPLLTLFSPNYKYRVLRNVDINREQVAYLMESALFKEKGRKKVSPQLYQAFNPEVFTQRFHRFTSLPGSIQPSMYYDAKTKLPDSSLLQFERLLASQNMQLITPFLDHRLVEFLACVPEEIKFKEKAPAALLASLMEKLCHQCPSFPESKETYLNEWRLNPKFREVFGELGSGRLEDEGLLSIRWIRQQLGYPFLIPRTFKQFWALLILEIWFRLFITRPIDTAPSDISLEELLK